MIIIAHKDCVRFYKTIDPNPTLSGFISFVRKYKKLYPKNKIVRRLNTNIPHVIACRIKGYWD